MFCFFANNNCYLQEIRNYTEWVQVSKIWISVLKQERERERNFTGTCITISFLFLWNSSNFYAKRLNQKSSLFLLFYGNMLQKIKFIYLYLMKFLWILIQSAKVLFKNALQISLNFTLCSFNEDSSEPFNFQNCFLYNEMKTLRYSMTLIISLTQIIKIIKVLVYVT